MALAIGRNLLSGVLARERWTTLREPGARRRPNVEASSKFIARLRCSLKASGMCRQPDVSAPQVAA